MAYRASHVATNYFSHFYKHEHASDNSELHQAITDINLQDLILIYFQVFPRRYMHEDPIYFGSFWDPIHLIFCTPQSY